MFHIIAQSVKQITDYSILEDDKYIMLYKSNYARIFDETNAETIVEINKKLLDVVGELIIHDLQKTNHKVDTINKLQREPITKHITLSSSMRKLDSKNRYHYTLHVNETMIQIQTITILKENNPLCTSLINVKINNDLLQCEYYESKWFNKRELLIYHPLNTINHEIKDKSIDIQFLSNNMIEIEPQNDIFQINLRKYGWNEAIWDKITLNEFYRYPYIIDRNPGDRGLRKLTLATIPHIRADWFIAHGAKPELYHEILKLPDKLGNYN